MGFNSAFSSIASNGLNNARLFVGDIAPILAIVVGLAGLGIVVGIFSRFVK